MFLFEISKIGGLSQAVRLKGEGQLQKKYTDGVGGFKDTLPSGNTLRNND